MTDLYLIFNPSMELIEDMENSENIENNEIDDILGEFNY